MKYLIVQDWRSTHGNHAGMKHMCDLLVSKYPNDYEMYVKDIPRAWGAPKSLTEKILWKFFGAREKKQYLEKTYPQEYLQLCKPMFAKLQDSDEIFLLEYMLPWASQYELACYIRENYPKVKIYALSHLTCKYFDEMLSQESNLIKKWAEPVDKLLTLGSSLSAYFEKAGIPKDKISTGFHYVDSDFYQKQDTIEVHNPLRVIMMGALQRDYGMLSEIVKCCPEVYWTICRGRKNVDDLFPKSPNVELKGFLEEEELRHQMDIADVSLNIMEDTVGSNVITTSMSMGLAMIVSDVGSIRDYCNEKNTLFCSFDKDSFINSIRMLENNSAKLEQMKAASINNANRLRIDNINKWFSNL